MNKNKGSKKKNLIILIVEDDDQIRDLILRFFKDSEEDNIFKSADFLSAGNGAEAKKILAESMCAVDLLITDYSMPELNGCQLIEWLKEENCNLKILTISGFIADRHEEVKIMQLTDFFLSKPFGKSQIVHAVKVALGMIE